MTEKGLQTTEYWLIMIEFFRYLCVNFNHLFGAHLSKAMVILVAFEGISYELPRAKMNKEFTLSSPSFLRY